MDDFQSEQGVYIANNSVLQSFVEEGKDVEIKGLQVALAVQDTKEIKVTLEAGNQAQLDAYNAKNGTNYIVLPKEMYELSLIHIFIVFEFCLSLWAGTNDYP